MRRRPVPGALALALLLAVSFGLAGCSTTSGTASTASGTSATSSLLPGYHTTVRVSAALAKAETTREANAITALIPKADVVHIVTNAKLVTSSSGSYYAVLRTITVASTLDAVARAETMEKTLTAAGWVQHTASTDKDTGDYLAGLASSKSSADSWFLLLGGDKPVGKSQSITVQIGSPDLQK